MKHCLVVPESNKDGANSQISRMGRFTFHTLSPIILTATLTPKAAQGRTPHQATRGVLIFLQFESSRQFFSGGDHYGMNRTHHTAVDPTKTGGASNRLAANKASHNPNFPCQTKNKNRNKNSSLMAVIRLDFCITDSSLCFSQL